MPFTILVSTRFFDDASVRYLEENGCVVRRTGLPDDVQDDALDPPALHRLLEGVDGWLVGTVPVTREILAAHPGLKAIARRGVGYNNVDVAAAREFGIRVTIAPGGNEAGVADHAVGMMLALAKRLAEGHRALQGGSWAAFVGTELYRKTVGLVGFGRIARAVARRVQGFDARILAYDPVPDEAAARATGTQFVDLRTLVAESDYVSLHLPLIAETRHMVDREMLLAMKPTAILINTARGGLVDEVALRDVMASGHLWGAGLDVFEDESSPRRDEAIRDLLALPNVIASAHAAGSSDESLGRTNRIAAETLVDLLNGREPPKPCIVV